VPGGHVRAQPEADTLAAREQTFRRFVIAPVDAFRRRPAAVEVPPSNAPVVFSYIAWSIAVQPSSELLRAIPAASRTTKQRATDAESILHRSTEIRE
jgi:hypothetical protein